MILRTAVVGDGPATVLVHAAVGDHRMWEPLLPLLGGRIAMPDLRGFGSPGDRSGFNHAQDVLDTIDDLGLERPALVGASFGGAVALECAVLRPDGFRSLVLLDSALPEHEWSEQVRGFGAEEDRLLEAGDLDGAAELNVEMWVHRPDARDLVRRLQRELFEVQLAFGDPEEDELDPPATERLETIAMPAVVAVGEHDVSDFHAIAQRLAAGIPGARLVVIPGCGHLPSIENPAAVAALLA